MRNASGQQGEANKVTGTQATKSLVSTYDIFFQRQRNVQKNKQKKGVLHVQRFFFVTNQGLLIFFVVLVAVAV